MSRRCRSPQSILTISIPSSFLKQLNQFDLDRVIESKSDWIRDAIEFYYPIFMEAQAVIQKLPPIDGIPIVDLPLVESAVKIEIAQVQKETVIQYAIKKYAKRNHVPLGNMYYPELDYSKPQPYQEVTEK